VVIDANNSQVDGTIESVTTIEPLADKWRAFGWHTVEVNGHDVDALAAAFAAAPENRAPVVVIARTDILGRLRSLPVTVDGHFIKLDAALESAVTSELESSLV
jgi:transketolase